MQRPMPQLSVSCDGHCIVEYRESRLPVRLGISRYGDPPNSADLLDRDIGDMDRHTSTSNFTSTVTTDAYIIHTDEAVSSVMVTGPSFWIPTCIYAPNWPSETGQSNKWQQNNNFYIFYKHVKRTWKIFLIFHVYRIFFLY